MPGVLTTEEVNEFRDLVVELGMPDQCALLGYATTTQDSFGQDIVTYPIEGVFWCRFSPVSSKEGSASVRQGIETPDSVAVEARLHLPIDTDGVFKPEDKVQILTIYGEPWTRQPVYQIVGEPLKRLVDVLCSLKSVTL